jgi:hypothetical protein
MKTLKEIRESFDLYPQECSSIVKYFKGLDIDWDVYLPSIGMNLQRDYVWNVDQKRELIWSILLGRHVPHLAVINTINKEGETKDLYLIIDGKQRLSTIFNFIDNKFTLLIDDREYYFSELPEDYKNGIIYYHFRYYVVNEPWDSRITDEQKIKWFKFINFAGTPQDKDHLNKLVNK